MHTFTSIRYICSALILLAAISAVAAQDRDASVSARTPLYIGDPIVVSYSSSSWVDTDYVAMYLLDDTLSCNPQEDLTCVASTLNTEQSEGTLEFPFIGNANTSFYFRYLAFGDTNDARLSLAQTDTFTATNPVNLTIPAIPEAGAPIEVRYTASPRHDPYDMIAMYIVNDPNCDPEYSIQCWSDVRTLTDNTTLDDWAGLPEGELYHDVVYFDAEAVGAQDEVYFRYLRSTYEVLFETQPMPRALLNFRVSVNSTLFSPGDRVTVFYETSASHSTSDYIALYANDTTSSCNWTLPNCYVTYKYVPKDAASGNVTFDIPNNEFQSYLVRYLSDDVPVAETAIFRAVPDAIQISVDMEEVTPGQELTVFYKTGQFHSTSDYIALYLNRTTSSCNWDLLNCYETYKYVPAGSEGNVTFTVPTNYLGAMKVRYLIGSEQPASEVAVTAQAFEAWVSIPSFVIHDLHFVVNYTAPRFHSRYDYIGIYPADCAVDDASCRYLTYQYVPVGSQGNLIFTIDTSAVIGKRVDARYYLNGDILVNRSNNTAMVYDTFGSCASTCSNRGQRCYAADMCTACGGDVDSACVADENTPVLHIDVPVNGFYAAPLMELTIPMIVSFANNDSALTFSTDVYVSGLPEGAQVVPIDLTSVNERFWRIHWTPTVTDMSDKHRVCAVAILQGSLSSELVCFDLSVSGSYCALYGEPHFATFDGTHYDFQGVGDYWLVRTEAGLDIQARFEPCWDGASYSCITGVAIREGFNFFLFAIKANDISLTFNRSPVLLTDPDAMLPDEVGEWEYGTKYGARGLNVYLESGLSIGITRSDYTANVILLVPASDYMYQTSGLCGTWDDNSDNDLENVNRTRIDVESTNQQIYDQFGTSWRTVDESDSLFDYSTVSYQDINFPADYAPSFSYAFDDEALQSAAEELCSSYGLSARMHAACLHDVAVTGSLLAARGIGIIHMQSCSAMTGNFTGCQIAPNCQDACSLLGVCQDGGTCKCVYADVEGLELFPNCTLKSGSWPAPKFNNAVNEQGGSGAGTGTDTASGDNAGTDTSTDTNTDTNVPSPDAPTPGSLDVPTSASVRVMAHPLPLTVCAIMTLLAAML